MRSLGEIKGNETTNVRLEVGLGEAVEKMTAQSATNRLVMYVTGHVTTR